MAHIKPNKPEYRIDYLANGHWLCMFRATMKEAEVLTFNLNKLNHVSSVEIKNHEL
tara:strand:+ start:220 stop:387 length:168 start_codon:yes stop_codon:yes gene_type:complete